MSNIGFREIIDMSPLGLKRLNDTLRALWSKVMGGIGEQDLNDSVRTRLADAVGQEQLESVMEQTAEEISARATRSSVAALEGRMSQAETSLTLKADQATLTSTANGLQSQIDAVPGNITLAINNVQVGGTNLLPHRADIWVQGSFLPDTGARNSGQTNRIRLIDGERITIVPGTEYIISRHTIGSTTYWLVLYAYDSNGNYVAADSITDWISTYPYTYTPTTATRLQIGMRHGDNSAITTAELVTSARFKIEKGNKATDWSPSPEDPASGVVNNSITIDTEGIKMSSSDVFQLDAVNGSKNSFINIHGLFTASNTGGMTAQDGHFSSLDVSGRRVLTEADMGVKLFVQNNQPSAHNALWFKPSSITSVTYTAYTADSRNSTVQFGYSQRTITRSFVPENTNTLPSGNTITHELKFTIISLADETLTGVYFTATMSKNGSTVTIGRSATYSLTKWQTEEVTISLTNNVNNFTTPQGNISVAITCTASAYGGIFLQSQQYMTLKISTNTGSGTQAGTLVYLP